MTWKISYQQDCTTAEKTLSIHCSLRRIPHYHKQGLRFGLYRTKLMFDVGNATGHIIVALFFYLSTIIQCNDLTEIFVFINTQIVWMQSAKTMTGENVASAITDSRKFTARGEIWTYAFTRRTRTVLPLTEFSLIDFLICNSSHKKSTRVIVNAFIVSCFTYRSA